MKQSLLVIVLMTVLGLAGCQKNDGLTFTERRIVGEWNFEKVIFYENWRINGDNLTEVYDGQTFTFFNDFSAALTDANTGDDFSGVWELSEVPTDDYTVQTILASFTNDATGELKQVIFENIGVTKKRLNASYNVQNGRYRYFLRRK